MKTVIRTSGLIEHMTPSPVGSSVDEGGKSSKESLSSIMGKIAETSKISTLHVWRSFVWHNIQRCSIASAGVRNRPNGEKNSWKSAQFLCKNRNSHALIFTTEDLPVQIGFLASDWW